MRGKRLTRTAIVVAAMAFGSLALIAQQNGAGSWPYFSGDMGSRRYSPLDQITVDNAKNLRVVWRRPAVDADLKQLFPDTEPSNYLRSTPVFMNGVLYSPNAVGLIEAFDAASGTTLWKQEPFEPTLKEVSGQSSRGVDYYRNGTTERLLQVRGTYLYAVDVKTGKPVREFGERGRVNLKRTNRDGTPFFSWTGPIVVNGVVVISGNGAGLVGGGYGDGGYIKESTPEDVRGYDVMTGKLLWQFHVVPQPGEFGHDTWGKDSWKVAGNLGSWSSLSADEELGIVYVPLTSPTASYYGGWRPGDNLYSNSLVALNVKTGQRVWHFQMVHHDLWEYDTVGPPVLGDITVDGRPVKAVMQSSKTGFLYVFDRETGTPVWPIEERPVPQSNVPGEYTSPTQPFPTKPAPFDRISMSEDDLIDFTPELRKEALEIVKPFTMGPIFTPPTLWSDKPGEKKGTLVVPGWYGGGNWNTGAFDPETGVYYAISHTIPNVYDLSPPREGSRSTMDYSIDGGGSSGRHTNIKGPQGLPLTKPPYGRITAIDMNRGEHKWMVANGDGPRDHPALKGLNLPPLGIAGRPAPLLTKTLLFLGEGSDAMFGGATPNGSGKKFRAYDKNTGTIVWETELPGGTTGAPMTYMSKGVQYVVVPIGAKDHTAEWVAFAVSGNAITLTKNEPSTLKATAAMTSARTGVYSSQQADRGAATYKTRCAGCHGTDTTGGMHGVPLLGDRFMSNWQGKPVRSLYSRIISTMPPTDPGSLQESQVLDLVAQLLRMNSFPVGSTAVAKADALNTIEFPKKEGTQ